MLHILSSMSLSMFCWAHWGALQKRMNRSRCRLGDRLVWAHGERTGATWRIRINAWRRCVFVKLYVKLSGPLIYLRKSRFFYFIYSLCSFQTYRPTARNKCAWPAANISSTYSGRSIFYTLIIFRRSHARQKLYNVNRFLARCQADM